jgi:hypothetical protein
LNDFSKPLTLLLEESGSIIDYETISFVKNGVNGADGKDGKDGADAVNCYIESSLGVLFEEGKDTETDLVAKIFLGETELDPDGTEFTYIWYKVDGDGNEETISSS